MSNIEKKLSASLWRRLLAMGYDSLLLIAIAFAYTAIHLFFKSQLFGTETIRSAAAGEAGDLLLFVGVITSIALFFCWFWIRKGQTLGMLTWKIRVEQTNGKNINIQQAIIRLLIAPLSLLCFGAGYAWCLFGDKQCWQDIISKTRVVVLPKSIT